METLYINFAVPQGWHELSDKQLRYLFGLIAADIDIDAIMTTCLLHWSGTKVIGRHDDGSYLLKQDKTLFITSAQSIAELLPQIGWLAKLPTVPVRLSAIGKAKAIAADFQGVPFETFIICDNLYQGYLQTRQDAMLDELAAVMYPGVKKLTAVERINIFYWFASLKEYFAKRFSEFFQPVGNSGNLLGSVAPTPTALQEAMDAQIRALTKGDITKEAEILALDTWRALTELNAQAKEYRELQAMMKK